MAKPIQNKVGNNLPPEEVFREMNTRLRALITEIRAFGISLTPNQRKGLNNPRRGSEDKVNLVLDLADQEGVTAKNVTRQGVQDDLRLAKETLTFFNLFTVGQQLALDTLRQAKSEYWEAAMAIYRILKARAESDPALAQELVPFVDFMALGSPEEKEEDLADVKEETEL